jgi:hypothetical protein
MNERIKQLAEQAHVYGGGHSLWCHSGDVEKFAELIVQECMEQVWYTREDGINGNVSEVIKERMKQHFGVEL